MPRARVVHLTTRKVISRRWLHPPEWLWNVQYEKGLRKVAKLPFSSLNMQIGDLLAIVVVA